MKSLTIAVLLAAICNVSKCEDFCFNKVTEACSRGYHPGNICNSRIYSIDHIEPEMQAYINSHLIKSYEYLLMATHFNSHHKNRPGIQKLYQGLSDRSFDDTIEMIKQLSRRGGKTNFHLVHESPASVTRKDLNLEADELHSLAMALDTEKQLFEGAIHIHTRSHHASERDPEMAQYIGETLLSKQAKTIRKLSGYVSDLSKLLNYHDPSLALYFYDEYIFSTYNK